MTWQQTDLDRVLELEIFELPAQDPTLQDADLLFTYLCQPQYRLAPENSSIREAMLKALVTGRARAGGWFWATHLPGGLPGVAHGPFASYDDALADALR